MTFDEFIEKHEGKAVDYDGAAGRQCVDLAEAYFDEVFGSGISNFWYDARHFYELYPQNSWLKKNFDRIPNIPDFVPKKGDVAVWGGNLSSGGWGHIALCTGEGDTSYFMSYDQNWTGNGDPCTKIRHSYRAFLGVLRPKDQERVLGKPAAVKGDINGDGKVNVTDVSKAAAHIKGEKPLTADEIKNADINGDGKVNVADLAKIAAKVKGQ